MRNPFRITLLLLASLLTAASVPAQIHPVAAAKALVKLPGAITKAAGAVVAVPYRLLAGDEPKSPFEIDPSKQTPVKPAPAPAPAPVPAPALASASPILNPKAISDNDIGYYFPSDAGVIAREVPNHPTFLERVVSEYAWQNAVGLNPGAVALSDFEVRTFSWGLAGLQALVKSTRTGRSTLADVRVVISYGAYPLMVEILQLGKP